MSLQDAIGGQLAFMRGEAERRMQSRCRVRRESGSNTVDGIETVGWANVHAGLPLRLKGKGSSKIVIGDVQFQQAEAEAHMPADTADLEDGDVIEITAGEWWGTFWRIVEAVKGDQRTARRVPVEEISEPEGWSV